MHTLLAAMTIAIVFLSVISSLQVLSETAKELSACRPRTLSEGPGCDMLSLGKALSLNMVVLGAFFLLASGASYVLVRSVSGRSDEYSMGRRPHEYG